MLYGIILVIHVFVCFVLIAVILLQAGRGGGLSDSFGGGAQAILGSRGAVYLTRATTACATVFMLTSLTLAVLSAQRGRSLMERVPAAKSSAPTEQPKSTPTQTKSTSSEPVSSPSESSPKP